ncbi:MAG: phosphate signaling complex protein PhoU [Acidobacteriota bacterium]
MKKFEQELMAVKERVMEMGALAERMVAWASDAFLKRDKAIITQVMEAEERLDRYQIELDRDAIRLITVYTPTAKDLRMLMMIARITTELERIGDQAVNNCEYVEMFLSTPPPRALDDISRMTEITCEMVHGALTAFEREDIQKATEMVDLDNDVDRLNQQTFTDLLADRTGDPEVIKRCMSLILLARSIERIADHAVNICEEVVYLVKGEDIRHQPPSS